MKTQYAIMSVDENPYYSEMWDSVACVWRNRMDITPLLVKITNDKNIENGIVKLPIIEVVDTSVQAQLARFWFASTLKNSICITTDIDIFPISKEYFIGQISAIPNSKYIHLNPIYPQNDEEHLQLPACYHVASGDTFKEMLNIPDKWEDFVHQVLKYCENKSCRCGNSKYWFADEVYTRDVLYTKLEDVHLLPREKGYWYRRINRSDWSYDQDLLKGDYYIDAHSIRPYSSYKTEIDRFVEALCG